LLISIGALSLFASGDVEPPAQAEIVAGEALPHVQILKVPHHGSAYQDARLYQELHPEIALISVGAGNSYGHPAQKTLLGLRQAGAHVFRTDLDGAISIDASLRIRTNKKAWWKISWG
jgi:competence protein ComEC